MIRSDYMQNYTQAIDRLIEEKHPKKTDQLSQTIIAAVDIEDNGTEFKAHVQEAIRELCRIKPGRKIMKLWLRIHEQIPLKVRSMPKGQHGGYLNQTVYLENEKHFVYPGLGEDGQVYEDCCYPLCVTLAHEVLHMIHDRNQTDDTKNWLYILPKMEDGEEQYAITGVNLNLSQRPPESYLCENAVLLALKLLPRVHHAAVPETQNPVVRKIADISKYKNTYYDWLNSQLLDLIYIQSVRDLKEVIPGNLDKAFWVSAIKKNPFALANASYEALSDMKVVEEALEQNPRSFEGFPKDHPMYTQAALKAGKVIYKINRDFYPFQNQVMEAIWNTSPVWWCARWLKDRLVAKFPK